MTPSPKARTAGLGRTCLWLILALLAVWPLFAWYGYGRAGESGVWAAAFAAVVCGAGAILALVLVGITKGTDHALSATLLGTFTRTGLPLICGFLAQRAGGQLAQAGVFGMILCYYLFALCVETALSVRLLGGLKGLTVKA